LATLDACKEACISDMACVAIDWEPSSVLKNYCWTLASTYVANTTETGLITNYELNRACFSESFVPFKIKMKLTESGF